MSPPNRRSLKTKLVSPHKFMETEILQTDGVENAERMELTHVRERFPDALYDTYEFRGDLWLYIRRDNLLEICQFLRDELHYLYMCDVLGLDWLAKWEEGEKAKRFEVVYNLYSPVTFQRLLLKVEVDEGESLPSVTGIWEGANFPEREVYDLYGIPFDSHPNLKRILTPEDWVGHPLRKDYPLGGEEIPFAQDSFGPAIQDKTHPHAGESFDGRTGTEEVSGR